MIALKSCPVCGSDRISQYRESGFAPHVAHEIMPAVLVDAAIITRYSVCQSCRLIFQNPRMSDTELDKFYSQGFYRRTLNLTDEEKDSDELYRAKADTKIIKQYVGNVTSHLDVGGSRGYLLDEIGAGVMAVVEPNVEYPEVRGIKVYPELNKVPRKTFDLVTAIHTLEHVPAPLDYLKSMVRLAGKNGYVVIEVPTWKSPGGPLRLAHLYHFEPPVLRHMCALAELKIIHEEFTPHLMLICTR